MAHRKRGGSVGASPTAGPARSRQGWSVTRGSRQVSGFAAAIVMAIATGILVGDTTRAIAAFPGANGQVVFMSSRFGGDYDIVSVNADGSAVTDLTDDSSFDWYPDVSADGTKIAFSSNADGDYEIYSMNADGSGRTQLTHNTSFDAQPAWSPDGTKLVFSRNGSTLHTINANGSGEQLVEPGPNAETPEWSPDGTKIAFSANRNGSNVDVFVVNATGGGLQRLTTDPRRDMLPDWSPDGSEIAFVSDRICNPYCYTQIWVMDADGTDPTPLTATAPQQNEWPAWSPDGSQIVFSRTNSSGGWDLYLMDADGSDQALLTSGGTFNTHPDWTPALPTDQCVITQDRSIGFENFVTVTFVNKTDGPIEAYWLDYAGDRRLWLTVPPGESRNQGTYATHPWLVLDAASGECLGYTLGFQGEFVIGGTSTPPPPDTDGDGLYDTWETNGIDANDDGTVDLPLHLPPYNADPQHKDLFLEVDYMAPHQPQPGVLADVAAAFENAPVANPDGATGVRLHALLDEVVPTVAPICFWDCAGFPAPSSFNELKSGSTADSCDGYFGTAAERGGASCDAVLAARRLAFRYALFAHSYSERPISSGVAEIGANDLMVTVGQKPAAWITAGGGQRTAEAGTLMHELGHSLGLNHGGDDLVNCKPNYQSVMSYTRQVANLDPGRPLDYSREELPPLFEADLEEEAGTGALSGTVIYGVAGVPRVVPAGGAVDWNGNGGISSPVSADVNWLLRADGVPYCPSPAGLLEPVLDEVLGGHDDWAALQYDFRSAVDYADGVVDPPRQAPTAVELTADAAVEAAKAADSDGDGISNANESICAATRAFVQGSAKWQSSRPPQRAAATALVNAACKALEAITPATRPVPRRALVAAYKKAVDGLWVAGWLTPVEATTLKTMADTL